MIMQAVERGTSIEEIYLRVFQPVQYEIGRLWQSGKISVAEEHYCTACTQFIMAQLFPAIFRSEKNGRRSMVACIGSELHEVGARMVADFFELKGWSSDFLGANTPGDGIVEAIEKRKPDVLCLSVTIDFNLPTLIEFMQKLREKEQHASLRVLVGGRPFNLAPGLWRKVKADGTAVDALGAVREAAKLLNRREGA